MKKRRLKKQVFQILGLVAIAMLIIAGVVFAKRDTSSDSQNTVVSEEEQAPVHDYSVFPSRETLGFSDEVLEYLYQDLAKDQEINPDVKAILAFSSSLVIGPVVQGADNDHYLYTDWQTGEPLSYGSITLDYLNNIDSFEMNTIIYGHYVYESKNEDRSLAFTPLRELLNQENYDFNRYLALITNDTNRFYEIVSVYDCPMEQVDDIDVPLEELQFNLISYTEDYFNTYMKAVKEHEYYNTGVSVNYNDRLMTLQTCIEGHPESREIVLCKEMYRHYR